MSQSGDAVPLNSDGDHHGRTSRGELVYKIVLCSMIALVVSRVIWSIGTSLGSGYVQFSMEGEEAAAAPCIVIASGVSIQHCSGKRQMPCAFPKATVQIAGQEVKAERFRFHRYSEIRCAVTNSVYCYSLRQCFTGPIHGVTNETDCVVSGTAIINQFPIGSNATCYQFADGTVKLDQSAPEGSRFGRRHPRMDLLVAIIVCVGMVSPCSCVVLFACIMVCTSANALAKYESDCDSERASDDE